MMHLVGCATVPHLRPVSTLGSKPVSFPAATYIVRPGETLYRIAKSHHVEVSDLMRANPIQNPSRLQPGQNLFIPQPISFRDFATYRPIDLEQMRKLVGPKRDVYLWKTITLHHSATRRGGARLFDRDHRRRKMGGLFYHFVIGNGTYTPDGAVELGWRWKKQAKANRPYDIQICLVGNFDEQTVSDAQFNSVVHLVSILTEQYEIPLERIRRHKDLVGKHTDCPGKNFPFQRVLETLSTDRKSSSRLY